MTLEVIDYVSKYRNESLNIGELVKGTKIPKGENGKIPWHNEINENKLNSDNGLCVFCGLTSMNLMILDLDDETLFDHFKNYLDQTFIAKTPKKGHHIYFRTYDNPKSRSLTNSQGQHIDILGQGKIAVLPPSIHPETKKQYKIISDKKIKQLTTQEEQGLYQKLKDLGFVISEDKKPVSELHDKSFVKSEGQNRAEDLLRVIDSWKIKNPELTESMLYFMACEYQKEHFTERYPEEKIKSLVKQGFEFGQKKIAEREPKTEETIEQGSELFTNIEWPDVAKEIQNKYHFVTIRETKEMWIYSEKDGFYIPDADTYIEEEAQKLIFKCTTKSVNEIKNQIKRNRTMILSSDFFDSVIINTESGVIDPDTFEVLPHSPKYLTTTKLPFAVNMKASNFKLWNHITRNIIEPKDSKLFLEILWVLISWNNPHKKCIIFKGLSDTQKTTLMEIISWIIGSKNLAMVKPQKFLVSGDRFSMSRFIGKRANFSEEINNLTPDMLENLKAMIGGMVQETELKNSNDGREFDPKRFLFIFSTNFLDSIYQRIDDNSTINRFQFMMFKHVIKKKRGDWEKDFFIDEDDKRTSIETIIRLMLSWKKGGRNIQWDEAWRTKEILRAEQPIEDKYFESGRIIEKRGGKLTLNEVKKDFESFCGAPIENQALGYLMKNKGFESKHSGLDTYYQGYALSKVTKNSTL